MTCRVVDIGNICNYPMTPLFSFLKAGIMHEHGWKKPAYGLLNLKIYTVLLLIFAGWL